MCLYLQEVPYEHSEVRQKKHSPSPTGPESLRGPLATAPTGLSGQGVSQPGGGC